MQYRKHAAVKDALNPKNMQSVTNRSALPEPQYSACTKRQSLSRRSGYVAKEKDGNIRSAEAALAYGVHFSKALRHLNTLVAYFDKKLNVKPTKIKIGCVDSAHEDAYFIVKP